VTKEHGPQQHAANWKRVGIALAMLFLLLTSAAARAETNGPPQLSLDQARQLAYQRNWDLLASKSDVDLALAQRIVAHEFPNPTASFSVSKISVDSSHPNTGEGLSDKNYDTVAAVNQLIEIGGKRRARQNSATAGLKGAEARLADARRLLDQGVTQAYATALLAERNRAVLANSAASLRQEAGIAKARERAGDISSADRSQIEIAAQRFELDAENAATQAQNARIALEVLLGEKQPGGKIQLTDGLESLAEVNAARTNSMAIPMNRADVTAAEQAERKAEADLRLQKAGRIPDPTLVAQYEHEPPDMPHTVGFGLSFPLPLWNNNRGNISAAQAALDQARVQTEKIRAQAAADVAVARNSYQSALERWRRYRDELTAKSQGIRESVSYAYEKGGAALLDLLSAQRNDNDVRLAAGQAAADAATAGAALKAALEPGAPTHPATDK
jgi:cobalt-zinc-cadmium efflux system outer membrane protein